MYCANTTIETALAEEVALHGGAKEQLEICFANLLADLKILAANHAVNWYRACLLAQDMDKGITRRRR